MMELINSLPVTLVAVWVFGLGVIIGSFLNVVLYRLHTGRSLSGHSHCLSCGRRLAAWELIPLLSYLGLRGRCHTCRSYIPVRYFLVELGTGLLFVLTFFSSLSISDLFFGWAFVAVLMVVAVYDLRHMIIPDELVFILTAIALVYLGWDLVLGGTTGMDFLLTIGVAFLGSLFFYLLWQSSNGRWIGFGDVKLALPLGLLAGQTQVFSMIVLSFWVGASVGLSILFLQWLIKRGKGRLFFLRRKITIKSALPFAPFLIVGFLLVWFWQIDVVSWFRYDGF